MLLPHKAK